MVGVSQTWRFCVVEKPTQEFDGESKESTKGENMTLHGLKHCPDHQPNPPCASRSIRIKMLQTEPDVLMDETVQSHDAQLFFDWMLDNLPHGTFDKLATKITEHHNYKSVKG